MMEATKQNIPSKNKLSALQIISICMGTILLGFILFVLLIPSPIRPVAWTPPSRPALTGALAPNIVLQEVELLARDAINAPEDIAFDNQGRLYTGSSDGNIYRVTSGATSEEAIEVFAKTGGRPLGLAFDQDQNLIVADADRGLLEVTPQGQLRVLTTVANGASITYADELAIAKDGTIYFSDASSHFETGFPYDMLEARPYGRLLAYDPQRNETTELLSGLYFANGVALAPDESFVLVVESFRYRITRFWLTGSRRGTTDIFSDNLVGFADNITTAPDGTYWVAMNNLRPRLIDFMHSRPFLKAQFAKLGQNRIREIASNNRYGLVVQLDSTGQVVRSLHDPEGNLASLSTAVPHQDYLYLGSLFDNAIGRLKLTAN